MKKHYTAAFKAKLVLELLKEEKTLSQLAAEHQVHPNQLRHRRNRPVRNRELTCSSRYFHKACPIGLRIICNS
jgi:transposase-like protein